MQTGEKCSCPFCKLCDHGDVCGCKRKLEEKPACFKKKENK